MLTLSCFQCTFYVLFTLRYSLKIVTCLMSELMVNCLYTSFILENECKSVCIICHISDIEVTKDNFVEIQIIAVKMVYSIIESTNGSV
jgi:hypothetical protein